MGWIATWLEEDGGNEGVSEEDFIRRSNLPCISLYYSSLRSMLPCSVSRNGNLRRIGDFVDLLSLPRTLVTVSLRLCLPIYKCPATLPSLPVFIFVNDPYRVPFLKSTSYLTFLIYSQLYRILPSLFLNPPATLSSFIVTCL